jgi:hypothetical protein
MPNWKNKQSLFLDCGGGDRVAYASAQAFEHPHVFLCEAGPSEYLIELIDYFCL